MQVPGEKDKCKREKGKGKKVGREVGGGRLENRMLGLVKRAIEELMAKKVESQKVKIYNKSR